MEQMNPEVVRTKFIYGVVNTWDEVNNKWTTQYAVRYGDWKFMNFRRDWVQTSKCSEQWSNPKHEKYLFPTQPTRKNKMNAINSMAHNEPFKPKNASERNTVSQQIRKNLFLTPRWSFVIFVTIANFLEF